MKRFLLIAAAIALWAAMLYAAGIAGANRVEQALALKCARASDGTDQAIADCFAQFNQPIPGDL